MKITLPITKHTVLFKDYISHGAARKIQSSIMGDAKRRITNVTKDDLLEEFGPEVIEKLDILSQEEYKIGFESLKKKYLTKHFSLEATSDQLFNSMWVQIETMVISITDSNGVNLWEDKSRDFIDDLPQEDVDAISTHIAEMMNKSPLAEKQQGL